MLRQELFGAHFKTRLAGRNQQCLESLYYLLFPHSLQLFALTVELVVDRQSLGPGRPSALTGTEQINTNQHSLQVSSN